MYLLAILTGLPLPLGAVQLLWLNLVTNGGQDVALAFERAEPGLLSRPPRRPSEAIFDGLMIRQTLVAGGYMGIVAWAVFAWLIGSGMGEAEARNAVLFLMVLFENVQVFNARSETRSIFAIPLRDNWLLIGSIALAQGLAFASPFIPGLREVLEVQPISLGLWTTLLLVALSLAGVMEIEKLLRRRTA
jgi:magnesium-transporting ATPase (P-type)